MFPSYETIEEYQILVKNAINQTLFCCQIWSMNQLNIRQLSGKAKIVRFRRHFSDRSRQRYYISFLIKTSRIREETLTNIWRVKIPGIFEEQNQINMWILQMFSFAVSSKFSLEDWLPQNCIQLLVLFQIVPGI